MANKSVKFFLTRQQDGTYVLHRFPVKLVPVFGTDKKDVYIQPGEPFGVRHFCCEGVKAVFGLELQPLQCCRVTMVIKETVIDPPGQILEEPNMLSKSSLSVEEK